MASSDWRESARACPREPHACANPGSCRMAERNSSTASSSRPQRYRAMPRLWWVSAEVGSAWTPRRSRPPSVPRGRWSRARPGIDARSRVSGTATNPSRYDARPRGPRVDDAPTTARTRTPRRPARTRPWRRDSCTDPRRTTAPSGPGRSWGPGGRGRIPRPPANPADRLRSKNRAMLSPATPAAASRNRGSSRPIRLGAGWKGMRPKGAIVLNG